MPTEALHVFAEVLQIDLTVIFKGRQSGVAGSRWPLSWQCKLRGQSLFFVSGGLFRPAERPGSTPRTDNGGGCRTRLRGAPSGQENGAADGPIRPVCTLTQNQIPQQAAGCLNLASSRRRRVCGSSFLDGRRARQGVARHVLARRRRCRVETVAHAKHAAVCSRAGCCIRAVRSQPTRRDESCSAVTEQSADVHPLLDPDRTCRAKTLAGERCRRLSEADGLCTFHLRHLRESAVLDPLEVADWTAEVAVLRVVDAGLPASAPDTGSDNDGRAGT